MNTNVDLNEVVKSFCGLEGKRPCCIVDTKKDNLYYIENMVEDVFFFR